jgi:hypothetical protein
VRALYRNLFRRREVEAELEAEVQSYFALLVDRYVERGMPVADAQRQARVDMDGLERIKEEARDVRVGNLIESVIQDVRYGWRSLMKNPSFSAIAIVTLALGIGVNTAIFSVVYAVLLKPLPYDRPEQLALVWSDFEKTAALKAPTSGTILREIQDRATLLQEVAAMWPTVATFTGDGSGADQERASNVELSASAWREAGARADFRIGRGARCASGGDFVRFDLEAAIRRRSEHHRQGCAIRGRGTRGRRSAAGRFSIAIVGRDSDGYRGVHAVSEQHL